MLLGIFKKHDVREYNNQFSPFKINLIEKCFQKCPAFIINQYNYFRANNRL